MIAATILTALTVATDQTTVAQDFRIESDIFRASETKPASENLTLFHDDQAYDFQLSTGDASPSEIVIYRFDQRKFVLMDPSRKVKLELRHEQLNRYVNAMQENFVSSHAAGQSTSSQLPYLFRPQFEESFDQNEGWLELASPKLRYRCKGNQLKNKDQELKRYYEFVDQFTRLAATDPYKLPPFARLKLNQAIEKRGWMPTTVEVTLDQPGNQSRKISLRSRHYVVWQLSKKDQEKILSAESMAKDFESVSLESYRKLDQKHGH